MGVVKVPMFSIDGLVSVVKLKMGRAPPKSKISGLWPQFVKKNNYFDKIIYGQKRKKHS